MGNGIGPEIHHFFETNQKISYFSSFGWVPKTTPLFSLFQRICRVEFVFSKIYTKRYGIFKTPVIRCIEINVYQSINQRYGNFIERFFNHPPAPFFKFCLHSSYVMVNIGPVRLSYYSRGARPPNIF